ncbi:MAG: NAD(P)-dependent oxidoreductase [Thermoleophilaceae bacterium]
MAGLNRVGFAGLGLMGSLMAASLARAGLELSVWNRTRSKADEFAREHDAKVAETPAELADGVDAVVTIVTDAAAARGVLTGPGGVAEGAAEGLLCVDCSTIGPTAARELGEALGEREIAYLDAPVSGSTPGARDATLTIMVGGAAEDFERAKPLLDAMGELIVHVGELGHGQMVKVISNSLAAANIVALGEGMLLARRAGIDLDAFERVVAGTTGASRMLEQKAAPMRGHDYTTLFKLEQMLKDVRLCLDEADAAGIPFDAATGARERLEAAVGLGHGSEDFAAVIEALERRAGERL